MSREKGWGPGQTGRNSNIRGNSWGNPRGPQFTQTSRGCAPASATSRSRNPSTPFAPGMELAGPGTNPLKSSGNRRHAKRDVHFLQGSGTLDDPSVGWLFDWRTLEGYTNNTQHDHVAIAREVAKANGFRCILIRKEAHGVQCTYTVIGTRNIITGPNGRSYCEVIPADDHIAVFMGPDHRTAMVSGHVYVLRLTDPETGETRLRQVDDLETQRRIVNPGYSRVAEEFWLTSGT